MIIGIGTDLLEIPRMARALAKPRFAQRMFSQEELALWERRGRSAAVLAGNFAAKEAVVKALGTGFAGIRPSEVEILRDAAGAPYAVLNGHARAVAEERGIARFHVSISNTETLCVAYVIAENDV